MTDMGIFKEDAIEIVSLSIKSLQRKACNITENNSKKKQALLASNTKHTESSSTEFVEEVTVNTKFDFKLINAIEVYNKVKTLDKNKATGIDNIPNKMLLLCADIVPPHLVDIFNYSLV